MDEPMVFSKQLLDAIVVEDSQSDSHLPNPPCTDEGYWNEVLSKIDDPLDQLITSKTAPQRG